jgi:GH43 family beta-xylosidase
VTEPSSIARLRARLIDQVAAPLVVSARAQQYFFDEDSAAYAEIDIRRGESFAVVVVIGSLPSEQFIVDVWHRFTSEVWLIDTRDHEVYLARAGQPHRVLGRKDTLRSAELPGVTIAVDALFAPPS